LSIEALVMSIGSRKKIGVIRRREISGISRGGRRNMTGGVLMAD